MYEGLFEFAPDAIIVVGRDGNIIRVNNQAANLFGYSRNELLNLPVEILLPERFREKHAEHRGNYMSDPHIRPMGTGLALYARRKDESEFSADIALGPMKAGKDFGVMAVIRDVTSQKRAEEALASASDRYRTLFNAIDEGFCIVEVIFDDNTKPVDYRFLEINPSFERQTGLIDAEGKRMRELAPKHEEHWFEIYGKIALTGEPARFQNRAEQLHRWYDVYAFRVGRPENRQVAILFNDITERKKTEDALILTNFSVDHASVSAFLIGKDARILYVNEQACRSLRYSRGELLGMAIQDLDPYFSRSVWNDTWNRLKKEGSLNLETAHRRKDGILVPVQISANYISFGGREYDWAYSLDITERKRMEHEIRHLAHHDALTGLPNRRLFRDIADLELAQARRNGRKFAILFLDLDRFKEINDTLGHYAGDELLKQVARLFRETIRASDTVARIGGDEFNIILADIVRSEDVSDIAQKIISRFRSPFSISGNELNVTASIGISVYPDDSREIDTLLRYADIAMYDAKETGRNTFRFYNPAINVRSIERIRMSNMLRRSIDMGELVVYYQPQINIQNRRMICAEALVRWQHPEKGFLTPDRFLAQAEETGFITEIDEWTLKTVCAEVTSWIASGLPPVCVTVNLSARQFAKPDLVDRIASILKETGMEPDCLDLEVTETTAMNNVDRTAFQLRQLREMGVHVSIDDFGTGYSSLNYLKKLPIERLKIDKSFIRDIAHDPDDRAIISAVTSMARKMGIRTVAEGVETEAQLAFLRSTECDEAQGFLFSRPVASRVFRELISSR
jgi:diguanylate cyclase (GGDEF)-like protein/PAS domain S-box-containing protein